MMNIAIIPARGGSKSVPSKNIKHLNGIPLIAYSIIISLENPLIDEVIVSTDDDEIASIALKYGANVPFLRPKNIATDDTPDKPVILHALEWFENENNFKPDLILYLRPTSPFRSHSLINKCITKIAQENSYSSLRTVNNVRGIHHPYWMFRNDKRILKPFINDIDLAKFYQRQLLPECLRLNGVVDILKPQIVKECPNIYGNSIGHIITDDMTTVDIDDQIDFDFAEFLLKKKQIVLPFVKQSK